MKIDYTSDLLIFGIDSRVSSNVRSLPKKYFSILLVKRNKEPFINKWCLPGGYVGIEETSKEAALRILEKETSLKDVYMQQVGNGNMIKSQDNALTPPQIMTDYYLEDGTYMKFGDITIGYTFDIKEDVAKYLSKARIYVTGQNIATISNYSGVDPEAVNMTGLEPGIEGVTYYPTTRTFMLGVNLAF